MSNLTGFSLLHHHQNARTDGWGVRLPGNHPALTLLTEQGAHESRRLGEGGPNIYDSRSLRARILQEETNRR